MTTLTREALVALDKRYVWHPYTPMRRYVDEVDPFVVVRASGPYLFDADGRRYVDGNSSWWVAALGHGHPRLIAALKAQADVLAHTSLAGVTHEPAARLAERLVAAAPQGLTRVFYSDDGSTALEAAIKMALGFHANQGRAERRRFVSLGGAFHGETLGVTALGGVELFRRSYADVLMRVDFVEPPGRADAEDCAAASALVEALRGGDAAALVLEPLVQGAAGMRLYPPWYLALARRACDEAGALLIVDEVFTGYGRTGTFWAVEAAGVSPDLLCTAKAFSGGLLPMAATLVSDRVFDAFLGAPERAFFYGHSFCGNPLGARVALEVLDVYAEEAVMEGVPERARRIAAAFERIGRIAGTKDARSLGMIGAVDLAQDAGYLGRTGWRVHEEARRRGAYVRPLGDVVYVAPPINTPLEALDELLGIVEDSVARAL